MRANGEEIRVAGTTIGNENRHWLVSALGFELEMELAPLMVFFRYDDVPGVIGKVGTVFGEAGIRSDRPPIVEKHFHRTPHGNPTADQKAFPEQFADASFAKQPRDDVTKQQRDCQEGDANHQTRAPPPEQLSKTLPRYLSTLAKEFPDCFAQNGGLLRKARRAIEMDVQRERCVGRNLAGPSDDEVLGVRIQIPLAKWRRVDGVEQLVQLRHVHFDDLAVFWYRIARGTTRLGCLRGIRPLNVWKRFLHRPAHPARRRRARPDSGLWTVDRSQGTTPR